MDFVADLIHEIQVHSGAILVLILTQCIDGVICHEFKFFFFKLGFAFKSKKLDAPQILEMKPIANNYLETVAKGEFHSDELLQ